MVWGCFAAQGPRLLFLLTDKNKNKIRFSIHFAAELEASLPNVTAEKMMGITKHRDSSTGGK